VSDARTAAAEEAGRRVADLRATYDRQLAELRAQLATGRGQDPGKRW
jgi:ribosomal protein L29